MRITVVGFVALVGVMVLLAFIAYRVGAAIEQSRRENLAAGSPAGAIPKDSEQGACKEPQTIPPSGC